MARSTMKQRTVLVSIDVLAALVPHAISRAISVNELARRLLAAAAEDDLVDSILDDMPRSIGRSAA